MKSRIWLYRGSANGGFSGELMVGHRRGNSIEK